MRTELCRHCGEETIEAEKCNICRESFKFLCPECNVIYEDYHSNCQEITELGKVVIDV